MHEHRLHVTKESQPFSWLIRLTSSSKTFGNEANQRQGSRHNAVRLAAAPIFLLLGKLILRQAVLARIRGGTERESRITPEVRGVVSVRMA
jgi:hypothetical protein